MPCPRESSGRFAKAGLAILRTKEPVRTGTGAFWPDYCCLKAGSGSTALDEGLPTFVKASDLPTVERK
jgi:hypothetical protein